MLNKKRNCHGDHFIHLPSKGLKRRILQMHEQCFCKWEMVYSLWILHVSFKPNTKCYNCVVWLGKKDYAFCISTVLNNISVILRRSLAMLCIVTTKIIESGTDTSIVMLSPQHWVQRRKVNSITGCSIFVRNYNGY